MRSDILFPGQFLVLGGSEASNFLENAVEIGAGTETYRFGHCLDSIIREAFGPGGEPPAGFPYPESL